MWLFAVRFFLLISIFSNSKDFVFSCPSLPMVCFAPVIDTFPVDRSMSLRVSHVNSFGRCPKSLLMDSFNAISILAWFIKKSISSSFGALRFLLYR